MLYLARPRNEKAGETTPRPAFRKTDLNPEKKIWKSISTRRQEDHQDEFIWKSGNQEKQDEAGAEAGGLIRKSGKEKTSMSEIGHRDLSGKAIAAAIEVHRTLGSGFIESIYEEALCVELETVGINYERQKPLPIQYKGKFIGEHRLDLLLENTMIMELKAISKLEDIHFAIVRSYLTAAKLEDALLLNFATMPLTIKRVGRSKNEELENS